MNTDYLTVMYAVTHRLNVPEHSQCSYKPDNSNRERQMDIKLLSLSEKDYADLSRDRLWENEIISRNIRSDLMFKYTSLNNLPFSCLALVVGCQKLVYFCKIKCYVPVIISSDTS